MSTQRIEHGYGHVSEVEIGAAPLPKLPDGPGPGSRAVDADRQRLLDDIARQAAEVAALTAERDRLDIQLKETRATAMRKIAALEALVRADGVQPLQMKRQYSIPGLEGAWWLMGLETTDMGADNRATLHMIRKPIGGLAQTETEAAAERDQLLADIDTTEGLVHALLDTAHAERDEARAERDRLRDEPHKIERDLADALGMDDWEHPDDLIGIARALRLHDEAAADAVAEWARLRDDKKRWKAVADELLPRFDALVDDIIALIPDDYDSDDAVEAIILRWIKDVLAERDTLTVERDRLREHILDIDAHATPYGDIPDEPGFVGTYLVTAGALHRALGKIGHTSPSCEAEAQRDYLLAEREAQTATLNGAAEGAKKLIAENHELIAARDTLAAQLAEAQEQQAMAELLAGKMARLADAANDRNRALHVQLARAETVVEQRHLPANRCDGPCHGPDLNCTVPGHYESRMVHIGPWQAPSATTEREGAGQ